ncbi:MAG TPA: substrate-binding domain-containing protein [Myxococcales bacterium]|nr:substrate-binding domain-containing protein [Myxococcales bacterium]
MEPLSRNVGPYRLVASLGRGGQADVYLAIRRGPAGFSKLVVIKSIRPEMEDDPRFRDMLMSEAKLAAKLHHPNVVQTLEVGDDGGRCYIAMEFLDGQPLHKVVRVARASGGVALPLAAAIVSDMLAGLHSAHELRDWDGRSLEVIHRDVSPQNVFITYDGEVKLVDFGIAKAATGGEVTQAGVIKGKAAYMAPEQALGRPIDRRVDVYAAGIVLWELLTGRRLFYMPDAQEATQKLLSEPTPPVASVAKEIPPAVAAVADKALAREPDQRFATAAEMREALESALETSGVRKARREEVGRFVADLFERDRRWLRGKIRESIAAADSETPTEHTPAALPELRAPQIPSSHTLPPVPPKRVPRKVMAFASVALVVACALGFWLWSTLRPRLSGSAAGIPDLRLCGSNTIGGELAPALVDAFFTRKGARSIERKPGAVPRQTLLSTGAITVSIEAAGTATGFAGLAEGQCDIAMASRQMSDAEKAALARKRIADLRAPATEHVIALDGIAVIVHPNNRVTSLDLDQVKAIFSGRIGDWSAAGGSPGTIDVYAPDDNSGTYDTFRQLVLEAQPLASSARRLVDSIELSDNVATDPGAIGLVGLAYARSANAVALSERGFSPTLPTPFTVANESYPLSRRLYLYTLPHPRTPLVTNLVNFALSPEGQKVVRESGFVDLSIAARTPDACDARCPPGYAAATLQAKRLTVDLRFRPGTEELDSLANRNLERVVAFLRGRPGAQVLLLGFGDDPAASLARANQVAREFAKRGVKPALVKGFGEAMPVTSRNDADGRQRNRRVEVWIRDSTREQGR